MNPVPEKPQNVLNRLEDFRWTPKIVLAVGVFLLAGVYMWANFGEMNPWIGIPLFLVFCAPDLVLYLVAAGLWCGKKTQQMWRDRRAA